MRVWRLALVAGSPGLMLSSNGVSTNDGHSALTRTPRSAPSARSAMLRPTTACLVAVYGVMIAGITSPASDAVLTMCPWPCSSISG